MPYPHNLGGGDTLSRCATCCSVNVNEVVVPLGGSGDML